MKIFKNPATKLVTIIIVASMTVLAVTNYTYLRIYPQSNYTEMMANWGSTIGIIFTLLAVIFVAIIPSKVESQIEKIGERLNTPISTFDHLFKESISILEELGDNTNSSFMMIAAAPILGIELEPERQNKWRGHISHRITAKCLTEIIYLSDTAVVDSSPLYNMCIALENYLKEQKIEMTATTIYQKARSEIDEFSKLKENYDNLKLFSGGDPPIQLVLGEDDLGFRKGILYFASTDTLSSKLPVSGFVTQDHRQYNILKRLFNGIKLNAQEHRPDVRSSSQRIRDNQLLDYMSDSKTRIIQVPQLDNFELKISKKVFPPDLELVRNPLIKGIKEASELVWKSVPIKNRVGVDVGCGCGILGLILSNYSNSIILTDISEDAIANTEENFKKFKKTRPKIEYQILKCNLLEQVSINKSKIPIMIFNHPYYPTPVNVYHTGGELGGMKIINDFLESAKEKIGRGGIIMPYASISREHNPASCATNLGYQSKLLAREASDDFGDTFTYLFYK